VTTAGQRALLVVEDSDNDAALIEMALRKTGFVNPFRVVGRPEEAIRYLEGAGQYADRGKFPFPDLILLDHKMPGDGWVVIGWVRQRPELKSTRIVVFSGSDDPIHKQKACELGANDYQIKPQDFDEFTRTVRGIADAWLYRDRE
jgi:CheY-like chemotaxis protein